MANNPENYLIAGNDEHGVNPPTLGKRTPLMPYINRQIYENEWNYAVKNVFLADCLRIGFFIFDVKPNRQDASVSSRVAAVNRAQPSCVITFGYNAFGDPNAFSSPNGVEVFYSPLNVYSQRSQALSNDIYNEILDKTSLNGRGVKTLDVGILSNVRTVSSLIEAGFMTNFNEAKLMLDPDHINTVGRATCKGVCNYFNVEYTPIDEMNFPTLRIGSRGRFVRYLQFILKIQGYVLGNVDGIFGTNTQTAVKAFQQANGITDDGIVGRNTWYKLNNLYPTSRVLKKGSYGAEVKYLQQKLYSFLYPVGMVDGIFGSNTEKAVKEFQRENGLTPDGIVGNNTWDYLMDRANSRTLPTSTTTLNNDNFSENNTID